MELEQLEEEVRLESKAKDETESLPAVPTRPLPQVEGTMITGDAKVALPS
jgi:hypothetical protein